MTEELDLQCECSKHIDYIMKNFTDDCKFTLIVRKHNPNCHFVMTSDDFTEVAKVIAKKIDAISQHQ